MKRLLRLLDCLWLQLAKLTEKQEEATTDHAYLIVTLRLVIICRGSAVSIAVAVQNLILPIFGVHLMQRRDCLSASASFFFSIESKK